METSWKSKLTQQGSRATFVKASALPRTRNDLSGGSSSSSSSRSSLSSAPFFKRSSISSTVGPYDRNPVTGRSVETVNLLDCDSTHSSSSSSGGVVYDVDYCDYDEEDDCDDDVSEEEDEDEYNNDDDDDASFGED